MTTLAPPRSNSMMMPTVTAHESRRMRRPLNEVDVESIQSPMKRIKVDVIEPPTQPSFLIHFCYNCDGGFQEFTTAAKCVRQLFPNARILSKRTRTFPIRVRVEAKISEPEENIIVWESEQQALFQKHSDRRTNSMDEIRQGLLKLQRDYC
uniref:Uncharacterized protein n=1 Tax=Grammatophora oceanica TaxID=210454 RepID=A0A7S1US82_9STRA